ncbi:hypothetical protein [Paraburkholderia tagetis]|uniref:hypothetical protein n=1 Tax=Paraburkholderia tagetis TaxID=2913261 RepID=UPI003B75C959
MRELLRRGKLSGAKAAQILGLGTGGDAAIPYASWAILCEVASLGRIWQAAGGSPLADAPPSSSGPPSPDELADAFGRAEEFIERIWTGQDAASVATIGNCRDSLVRMKQAQHAMSTREQTAGFDHVRLQCVAIVGGCRQRLPLSGITRRQLILAKGRCMNRSTR